MDIRMRTIEYEMNPEVSEYLEQRLAHIEKFLGDEAVQARLEVELGRATGRHKHSDYLYIAEFQLVRPGQSRLVARNNEPTINAAIDNAKDELLRQLRQDKKSHSRFWKKSGALAKRLLRLE